VPHDENNVKGHDLKRDEDGLYRLSDFSGAGSCPRHASLLRALCRERPWRRFVLLTETRDAFAHRLRAIGRLHEAEDESQEFADLHATIRAVRRAYQTDGTMPDWEALAQAAQNVFHKVTFPGLRR